MTKYLLDTNIILRFSNPSDKQHRLVVESVAKLLRRGDECYLTPQVLIELWVVATRPVDVNGLGWSTEQTYKIIQQLRERFPLTDDTPQIFSYWLTLVSTHQIKGKKTHDARIVATMLATDIDHILTLNPKDFSNISSITVVEPQDIL